MQHTPDQQFPGSGSNQPEPAAQKSKNGLCRAWVVLVCILAVLAVGMSALVLHVYLSGKTSAGATPHQSWKRSHRQRRQEKRRRKQRKAPCGTTLPFWSTARITASTMRSRHSCCSASTRIYPLTRTAAAMCTHSATPSCWRPWTSETNGFR